jgi:glycosyltransferase involved in cell wall biosynthesis
MFSDPSRTKTFLSYSVPVIVSSFISYADQINNYCGISVNPDVPSFQDDILDAVNTCKEHLEVFSKNAYEFIQEFTFDNYLKKHPEILESFL